MDRERYHGRKVASDRELRRGPGCDQGFVACLSTIDMESGARDTHRRYETLPLSPVHGSVEEPTVRERTVEGSGEEREVEENATAEWR